MASTYDLRPTISDAPFQDYIKRIEFEIDSSDTTVFGAGGIAQNETLSLFIFFAGCQILAAQLKVITAQADISDVDLGISTDGSTNDGLIDGATLVTAAYVGTALAATVPVNAANQLVFTNKDAQAMTTAKVRIIVLYADMRDKMA